MGQKVQRVRTYVSEPQMASAIISAWREMFGQDPTKQQVSMMLAQNAFETANRKAMWNYNVGNLTTGGNDQFDYIDDLVPGMKFRAYPTLEAGTKDYIHLLHTKHYADAWSHLINPDPAAFSKSLKDAGYFGDGSEEVYRKGLTGFYNKFNQSTSYEQAQAGQVSKPGAVPGAVQPTAPTAPAAPAFIADRFDDIISKYLSMLSAASGNSSLKKLYKTALPNHNILIKVNAPDYTSAVEFARVLCTALDEELVANAYTHTDGHLVEIECSIAGPAEVCFKAVEQMSTAVAETFKEATNKIGGIEITTQCFMNKKSFYQPITFKLADTNYRKFLLKFI